MDLSHIPAKYHDAMQKRITAAKANYFVVQEAHACPDSGVAVIIGYERFDSEKALTARHFKSNAIKSYFFKEPVRSHHERLEHLEAERTRRKIEEEKAAKKLPHDLKIGEIIVRTWGVTMRRADFYKVVEIPTPRKVAIVSIGTQQFSGDWQNGSVLPDQDNVTDEEPLIYDVDFSKGKPVLKATSSIEHLTRWDGHPVSTWSD